MTKAFSRREFFQVSSAAAIAGAALSALPAAAAEVQGQGSFRGPLCLFSKAVPQLNWHELAQAAKEAGFAGVDLTVRGDGHVLPQNAVRDLPKAVEAIRAQGLEVPMITTELVEANDPTAEPILQTAKQLGIPFAKTGYYHYKMENVWKERNQAGEKLRGLVALAAKHEIQLGYHNHAHYIGAAIWDIGEIIEKLDSRWCGFYFDLGHSATDGGQGAWEIATNLVIPRLKMVAVKDFYWKEMPARRLEARTCPMGKGFVPWSDFLQTLAKSDFHGPVSLHDEYEIPGIADEQGRALSRAAVPAVMQAAQENLQYLKSLFRAAYSHA
ncbi:MAG: sugar phosphate isomerase/epimerase [Acidobacteria bacterium]|nr:sugar phosphate isomerase/epimerase [Acidobacteriota bacterium]